MWEPGDAVMTMADGVSRTTYMPKSIEREHRGMIARNGRGSDAERRGPRSCLKLPPPAFPLAVILCRRIDETSPSAASFLLERVASPNPRGIPTAVLERGFESASREILAGYRHSVGRLYRGIGAM